MRFGLDALLLACFAAREFGASPHFGLKNPCRDTPWLPPGPGFAAIDLGCGQGASTAALLLRSENVRALGVDFSPALIDAARKNISLLNLSERAAFRVLDLSRAGAAFPRPAFDLALSNPPYWERGEGRASRDSINDTARRGEGVLSLFIRAARAALVHHGLLYLIFPRFPFHRPRGGPGLLPLRHAQSPPRAPRGGGRGSPRACGSSEGHRARYPLSP